MKESTKKFLYFLYLFIPSALLVEVRIQWEYYHQYYPEWYTSYRVKRLINESNTLINDILIICERWKNDENSVYCMDACAEYYVWFERYKNLIKQKPELKESVVAKLKEAAGKADPEIDKFNTYLKELE